MRYYKIFLISCALVLTVPLYSQVSNGINDPAASFERFYQENYQETVYIHADKRYYLTGEFIKFKVYCLEKLTTKPSQLSRVAYVEVLDNENTPHLQARIELKDGVGSGEFYIPLTVNSGNFILRGYTRWMRNYEPENYFHAMVQIINPFKKPGLKPEPDSTIVEFYPEGGELINRLETKVVFHAKNDLGIPVDVEGRLMVNDTILVKEFKSISSGLGHFTFTPDLMNKYHVEIKTVDGYSRQDFITIKSRGLNTQIINKNDQCEIRIFCNESSILNSKDEVNVLLYKKGEILLNRNVQLQLGESRLNVDPNLINGVVSIAIFDTKGNLLTERKIFGQSEKALNVELEINKNNFDNREQVDLNLSEIKSYSNVSVSVSANSAYFDNHMLGIDDYLMLENSINYYYGIEKYLEGSSSEVHTLINDLLIAYGQIMNKSIFNNSSVPTKYIPEYRNVLVTGKLTNKLTSEPGFGIMTYLSVPGKITQIYADKSKYDGGLIFETDNFYGTNQVVVQNNYNEDTIYSIDIDNPYSEEYANIKLPEFDLDENLKELIERKSQYMQVYNANIKLTPNSEVISNQDSGSFYIEPDFRYYLDDYTRFVVMEEVMREYIAGVNVRKNRDGFHFMVVDVERDLVYNENPLMLLDGVPVFDADDIIALDPLKIQKIETVKTSFGRGELDCKGIVTYTSYAGDLAGYKLHKDALVLDFDGLQPVKRYFFPEYSNAFERNNTTPDFRSNLYWDSNLDTDQLENNILTFYTSDDVDNYEVRINGLNEEGYPVSVSKKFKVSRLIK